MTDSSSQNNPSYIQLLINRKLMPLHSDRENVHFKRRNLLLKSRSAVPKRPVDFKVTKVELARQLGFDSDNARGCDASRLPPFDYV